MKSKKRDSVANFELRSDWFDCCPPRHSCFLFFFLYPCCLPAAQLGRVVFLFSPLRWFIGLAQGFSQVKNFTCQNGAGWWARQKLATNNREGRCRDMSAYLILPRA